MAAKKSTVDKKALKADLIRIKNAKSEEDIDKICYKNVLRVFKANFDY